MTSSERSKIYYAQNKELVKTRSKLWKIANPEKLKESNRKSTNKRRKLNPSLRIRHSLNSRLRKKVKSKTGKFSDFIGCNPEQLREHLESLFEPCMTWENYGEWHIDHILPCDAFNLLDVAEQIKCFNYTNLQPLWATTEISKKYGSNSIGNINKSNKIYQNNKSSEI
jgi:hypothetical protein